MIKMVRVGPEGPIGATITVPKSGAEIKQREGYQVVEDASAGASSAGSMTGGFGNGFANGGPGSIMRRKPRKKKIAEAESVIHCSQCGKGFSSSGLTAPHHTGFSHCKDHKGMKVIAEGETSPKFTGYWKGKDKKTPGKKMVGDA
jgi:hypothetical protein